MKTARFHGDDDPKQLRAILDLGRATDDMVEQCQKERLTLEAALDRMLPALLSATGARSAFLHSYDEDLALRTFVSPSPRSFPFLEETLESTGVRERRPVAAVKGEFAIVAQSFDVAGEWFGSIGLAIPREAPVARDLHYASALLEVFAEEVDNFLQSIRAAREKQSVSLAIARALRQPSFAKGLEQAAALLDEEIGVERLLVVYDADEVLPGGARANVHVQLYEGGRLVLDTLKGNGPELPLILSDAKECLEQSGKRLVSRYGLEGAHEEVLSSGSASGGVVGRIYVKGTRAKFNTRDSDLLDDFASSVAARVVDFNKEWRTLARSFRPAHVSALLQTPGYQSLLRPREETVAIVFADISGFTRISEQFLKEPSKIGHLIDTWGREVVEVTWAERGVYDKMVGDCLVALFGPPFYDMDPGERLAAAIRAATRIVEVTRAMPSRPGLGSLEGSGIGVSIGINLAPLFVGRFGPNENFTGFSAGMNNTARLQHLARRDEILVMAEGLASLAPGAGFKFGDEQSAVVKNVAQPIRYRSLVTS